MILDDQLHELLDTLVLEGYALYPYTPFTTKNATPTPFGIVYPPAYAAHCAGAYDRIRLHVIAVGNGDTALEGQVRFLQAGGERHEAVQRAIDVPAASLARLHQTPLLMTFRFDSVIGRVRCSATPVGPDLWRVALCVHNTTIAAADLERAAALAISLVSTHPVLALRGGRFASALERDGAIGRAVATCDTVNTFPVLAGVGDDVVIGAQIALPDHPQIAPESRGSLFDATEIEEALLLHVLALSDGERAQIADHDPVVRAMVARAAAATPQDVLALHGRLVMSDPGGPAGGCAGGPETVKEGK